MSRHSWCGAQLGFQPSCVQFQSACFAFLKEKEMGLPGCLLSSRCHCLAGDSWVPPDTSSSFPILSPARLCVGGRLGLLSTPPHPQFQIQWGWRTGESAFSLSSQRLCCCCWSGKRTSNHLASFLFKYFLSYKIFQASCALLGASCLVCSWHERLEASCEFTMPKDTSSGLPTHQQFLLLLPP